jgi:hypothetical protein
VHEVLGESTAPVSHAAPAAEPHTAPAPEPDADHDARRLSTPRVSGETRRKHGRKGAPDHGSAAAQPDEYEKPAAE